MSGQKQGTGLTRILAQRLARVILLELPDWGLLFFAVITGAIWAASLFDWGFVTGRSAFWQFPQGTIGYSGNDMANVLVGYSYYLQSPWNLPLFYVATLGTPAGVNVIFMDVVPIVALIGKVIHSLTGATINLYGAYLFLCFALSGVMMTLILIAAKVRYAVAAIVGAVFTNAMPALLWRWGHISLEAQFLVVGALALYLLSLHKRSWRGFAMAWIAYLTLAYLTDTYLFAIIGAVWICTVIQRRLDGIMGTPELLKTIAVAVAVVTTVIALGGQFGGGGGLPFEQYGIHSMNLLSPFIPQESGFFPGLGGVIDATGFQYEGFNYLGLGLLVASLLFLPIEMSWLRQNLKRHRAIFVAFAALGAFAISHRVFAGHWLLFEVPLPHYLNRVFGIFRSSGRFFWPIAYAQMAVVIVLGFRPAKPLLAICLLGAAIVQLIDVQPLRHQIIASIADGPGAHELDTRQVARLLTVARQIAVVPSFKCADGQPGRDLYRANMELMLAAARSNVPINSAYSGRESYGVTLRDLLSQPSSEARETLRARRRDAYCEREIERARNGGSPGDIFVLLSDQPRQDEMAPDVTCASLSWARYCQKSNSSVN